MHRRLKTYLLIIAVVVLQSGNTFGQTTSSPYSIFGLGLLEGNSIGPSKAMGGTGIAFLSDRYINISNPASYSGIDSLLTIFEIGFFGKYASFSTNTQQQSAINANLKYVLMGFRVAPWISTSFGFAPYSSIGYNINTAAPLEGSVYTFNKTYSGEGGVNQVYAGASVKLLKNLSLGVNAGYLFGNVTHSESSDVYSFTFNDVTYVSNFNLNYGLNYHFAVKKWDYAIGLTYTNQKKLRTNNETTVVTNFGTTTLNDRVYRYQIPRDFGVGLAITREYFKAGIDFERSYWKGIDFNNTRVEARNSDRYSLGVEFPSQGANKGTGKMILYRFGAEYRGSYFVINNVPINYYGITLGAGIPLRRIVSILNVSMELGQNGTREKGLFRENYCTLHLDFALRDLWFMKKKYM